VHREKNQTSTPPLTPSKGKKTEEKAGGRLYL
jgi:hypothetical protein